MPFDPSCVIFTEPEMSSKTFSTLLPSKYNTSPRAKRFSRAAGEVLLKSSGETPLKRGGQARLRPNRADRCRGDHSKQVTFLQTPSRCSRSQVSQALLT